MTSTLVCLWHTSHTQKQFAIYSVKTVIAFPETHLTPPAPCFRSFLSTAASYTHFLYHYSSFLLPMERVKRKTRSYYKTARIGSSTFVIVERLQPQRVWEKERSPKRRERFFLQRELFSFIVPSLLPPIYRYPMYVRSRGTARAALAWHKKWTASCRFDLHTDSSIASASRGMNLTLLKHALAFRSTRYTSIYI